MVNAAGGDRSDYRVEAAADPESGLFYAEVFHPGDASVPIAKTKPVYASLEDARRRAEDAIRAMYPEQPTSSIGDAFLVDNA